VAASYTADVTPSPPETTQCERIRQTAAAVGVPLEEEAVSRLARFAELFLSWNERINLGGTMSSAELVERHFVDSFAASRFIPHRARLADVGSGGGLPALPLALVRPDLEIDMFEPTGKKVAFIRTAIRELGLKPRVSVHAERVVSGAGRIVVDVAMSRATLAPPSWLELGRTLVATTGSVLVFATRPAAVEERPRDLFCYASDRCLLVYGSA
jgi:16S rRNA (guanine527-N7)-methyltransferase